MAERSGGRGRQRESIRDGVHRQDLRPGRDGGGGHEHAGLETQAGDRDAGRQRDGRRTDDRCRQVGPGGEGNQGPPADDDTALPDIESLTAIQVISDTRRLRRGDGQGAGAEFVDGVKSVGRGHQEGREVDVADGVEAELAGGGGDDAISVERQRAAQGRADGRIEGHVDGAGVGVVSADTGELTAEIHATEEHVARALQRQGVADGYTAPQFQGVTHRSQGRGHADGARADGLIGAEREQARIKSDGAGPGAGIGGEAESPGAVLHERVGSGAHQDRAGQGQGSSTEDVDGIERRVEVERAVR